MRNLLVLLAAVSILTLPAAASAQANYVGVDVCKGCHMAEYKAWGETAHALDFSKRMRQGKETNLYTLAKGGCLPCHTVGYGEKSGYDPKRAYTEQKHLLRIQCENCHGRGSLHVAAKPEDKKLTIIGRPDPAKTCNVCHTTSYELLPRGSATDKDVQRPPHHPQAFIFNGVGGYEYPGIKYTNSAHTGVVGEQCVTCHLNPVRPHSLKADIETCRVCHGSKVENFDIQGVQTRVEELLHELKALLDNAADKESIEYKRANFNFHLVEADKSKGVHNYFYSRALLEGAIKNASKQK